MQSPPLNRRPALLKLAVFVSALAIFPAIVAVNLYEASHAYPPTVSAQELEQIKLDQINGTIDQVPERFRKLDGQRVKIEGEMWSGSSAADQLNDFDLTYTKTRSDYHGPPLVQQFIKCHSPKLIPYYYNNRVRVTGIFHVKIERGTDGIGSLYRLDVEQVETL